MCLRAFGGKGEEADVIKQRNIQELWKALDKTKQYPRRMIMSRAELGPSEPHRSRQLTLNTSIHNAIVFSGFGDSSLGLAVSAPRKLNSTCDNNLTQ